jgi:hypothetical protein
LLLDLPFAWRDLIPGTAVCTGAGVIVHAVAVLFLRNWFGEYSHAYGGFGVSLTLCAFVGIFASFWVWIAAVMGVYWERKAGPAAVAAMGELSADISALQTAQDAVLAVPQYASARARQQRTIRDPELRATGKRARRRIPEARDELTPQELQIASGEFVLNRTILPARAATTGPWQWGVVQGEKPHQDGGAASGGHSGGNLPGGLLLELGRGEAESHRPGPVFLAWHGVLAVGG